jgi:transposase
MYPPSRNAYRKGDNPTQTVANRFHVSKSTAAKWVHRCREELGLLPKTSRGRATGLHTASASFNARAEISTRGEVVKKKGS